jgi:indole-3-glycerol phosphate synthase
MTFLERVIEEKKKGVARLKREKPLRSLPASPEREKKRLFYETFGHRLPGTTKIIAEVKRASPSRGVIRPDLDLAHLVRAYEEGGAAAISVITEEKHFQGTLDDIPRVKALTDLPVLRKDFIVDEYELYESRAYGADAVLLISEALERDEIKGYLVLAHELDLAVLLEVHSEEAYRKVADLSGFILGINNRDLKTLGVDLRRAFYLVPGLPDALPVVVESGIERREEIEGFLELGVSGFLVGTSLAASQDPAAKLRDLRGVQCERG